MSETGSVTLIGDVIVPSGTVNYDFDFDGTLIGNLEAPMCSRDHAKRPKAGPHLTSRAIPSILQGGVISLANNHTLDFGAQGLEETILQCQAMDVTAIGAGATEDISKKPAVFKAGNISIGILARCETQFGSATQWRPGVAVLDAGIYDDIRRLKRDVDIVIVSIHGSTEMAPWPSPQWQKLLKSFIDAGATVVHGHHSHVPQGYEEYNNGLIFYGLGNFIVDPKRWKNIPNTAWSVVGNVTFSKNGIEQYQVQTAVIREDEQTRVVNSSEQESKYHKQYLTKACASLSDSKLLEGLWQEVSIRLYYMWYAQWLGFKSKPLLSRLKASLFELMRNPRKLFLLQQHAQKIFDGQYNNLRRYHLFACESHRDAIATALGVLSGELEDFRTKETKSLTDEFAPWLLKY